MCEKNVKKIANFSESYDRFLPVVHGNYLYRLAEQTDLPMLVEIYNESIATRQSTAVLQSLSVEDRQFWFDEHFNNSKRPIIVAICQTTNKVVAYGSFSDLYPMFAYHISSEISVYVAERAKGQGVGRQMVEILLSMAGACGISQVVAKIFAHNLPSLNLFKKQGFVEWGYLPKVCDMGDFIADVVILGKIVENNK